VDSFVDEIVRSGGITPYCSTARAVGLATCVVLVGENQKAADTEIGEDGHGTKVIRR
jgi:hypothetical protein